MQKKCNPTTDTVTLIYSFINKNDQKRVIRHLIKSTGTKEKKYKQKSTLIKIFFTY